MILWAVTAREVEIEAASVALAGEQQALADLFTPPDEHEVDKRRFDVSLAQLDLKEAQEKSGGVVRNCRRRDDLRPAGADRAHSSEH